MNYLKVSFRVNNFAVWLTGLPGSGKSTIANKLSELLEKYNIGTYILRMDEMRKYVTPDPKYTDMERTIVYNAFTFTAKVLVEHNQNLIMDATGNLRKYREPAKKFIPNFSEIYLKCPQDIAISREKKRSDTKGAPEDIYDKAEKGKATTVPGVQTDYEEPVNPDLVIDTVKMTPSESARKIYQTLLKH